MRDMELEISPSVLSRIKIRAMQKADIPALEWDGTYTHYRKLFELAYHRVQTRKGLAWLVEVPQSGIIGQVFIQLLCHRPELADGLTRAYLYSYRIKPAFRRMGIGKALLDFSETDLINRNLRFVTLNVAKNNDIAIKLYKKRDYQVIASEPGIWKYQDHMGIWHQVIEPAWRMEKSLLQQTQK